MPSRKGYNGQVSTGLIFAFDVADFFNSYKGEPAVNTIPSPQVNSYPTFGNGWASYNTNKYCGNNGCAVHWDIPAISSVSGNIITTAGSHGIYSFDVITPQTTGGGVTAGVNYFAKKISNTQFSLHEYNGSQGGDQGYINPATRGHKVHDSFWLDQRVSVNSSGFPTKWWGPPHLPNSGLVKEIIVGGFDLYPSQKTDCMRLHAHRPESADGMSYGPDAVVVPGQVHTYSFWTRALNKQTANAYGSMSNYNYGSVSPTSWGHGYTHGPLGVWTRQSFQFTPINENVISYFWPSALDKYDLANIQVEKNTHPTPFVAGTRSSTQSLLTVAGSAILDVANVSFDSAGALTFDGTNDYIPLSTNLQSGFTRATYEFICKPTSLPSSYNQLYIQEASTWIALYNYGGQTFFGIDLHNGSNWFDGNGGNTTGARTTSTITANTYYHVLYSWNGSTVSVYLNGNLEATVSTGSVNTLSSGTTHRGIGSRYSGGGHNWAGLIDVVKFYNRALTAAEVSQNFKAYKKRFNL